MKRYISAILIPCLLMQFFGCSSLSEIPVDELKTTVGKKQESLQKTQRIIFSRKI